MLKKLRKSLAHAVLIAALTLSIVPASAFYSHAYTPQTTVPTFSGILTNIYDKYFNQHKYDVEVLDLADITETLAIDYNTPQVQPLSGYYTQELTDGRTVKLYMPETATLRARFTVIALPEGVDTWKFLVDEGWVSLAEEHGEGLFVLEPGTEGWGSVEEEQSYLSTAMRIVNGGKNLNGISILSGHGTVGAVGYGEGCAILESWTAKNPMYVYGQVFLNGESAGQDYLDEVGSFVYGTKSPVSEESFRAALDSLEVEDACTRGELPVPTWFLGYAKDDPSIAYWKSANDCLPYADRQGVYHQDINSDAWQTLYANANIKGWNPCAKYGISEVRVSGQKYASASSIFDFLFRFTRYTATWAYSNNLATHMDYDAATKAARLETAKGTQATYSFTDFYGNENAGELRALEKTRVSYENCAVKGTLYAGSMAVQDYDGNGTKDPREFLVYVPDSSAKFALTGAPMIMVSPGKTQTAQTFLDCSGLVPLANDEGCILMIITQPYDSATSVSYDTALKAYLGEDAESANFARAMMAFMKKGFDNKYANIDFTRVYASGHSAGSSVSQTLAMTSENNWIAAVGSTSFITRQDQLTDGLMPTYFMVGHTDINDNRVDMFQDPYMSNPTTAGASTLNEWLKKVMTMNGIEIPFTDDDQQSFLDSCDILNNEGTRYVTYGWNNDQGINLVRFGRTLLREHNCYPEEFRYAWDFMEHFKVVPQKDGSVIRYYSESAFANPWDAVVIQDA